MRAFGLLLQLGNSPSSGLNPCELSSEFSVLPTPAMTTHMELFRWDIALSVGYG